MSAPAIHQPLDARYVAGRRYRLMAPFEYESALPAIGRFIVPQGFESNFHSTPRLLWWWLPPDDWAEAAVAHDSAYRYGGVHDAATGHLRRLTRRQADDLHYELLVHCGAPERRARWMRRGLFLGGWASWWKRHRNERDDATA